LREGRFEQRLHSIESQFHQGGRDNSALRRPNGGGVVD
jgi:hypothetical protein